MKRLFVLRHAKSSWEDSALSDFDRPLNKRGNKTAPRMGEMMRERGFIPDLIASSTAERARLTTNAVYEAGEFDCEIRFERAIYEASANTLIYLVAATDDAFDSLMIVGHNPGFEQIVSILTGGYERMPTAALAVVDLEIDGWKEIVSGSGTLPFGVLRPKEVLL